MQQLPTFVPPKDAVEAFFDWQRLDYFLGKDRTVRVSVYLSTKTLRAHFSDEKRFWRRRRQLLEWTITRLSSTLVITVNEGHAFKCRREQRGAALRGQA